MKQSHCATPPPNAGHNFPTPRWLRPVLRWSAKFSLNAPAWVPMATRNAPLRFSAFVLRSYYRALR